MLLSRIEELELLNRELLTEKEQEVKLEYAWTGNLGHWYWNIKANKVTYNPLKINTLGYEQDELPENLTYQFFTDMLHPDDYTKTMVAMKDHLYGRATVYEAEYRIRAKDGTYRWYYDRGKITQVDENRKPLFMAGIVFDITHQKEPQMELEYKNKILAEISSIDGLTRISNRWTLMEHLENEILDTQSIKRPLTIALIDIDDFKQVNDTRGHVYGDQVLVDVAAIIRQNIRDIDMVGRYVGEEFMVIFSNAEVQSAANIAERIRKAIASHLFADGLHVTISGGVKQYLGGNVTDFIHAADLNLYQAKRNGKNQIIF